MTRAISSVVTKKKHKKILKLAKGYRGRNNSCYRIAVQKVEKALSYSYRDRRNRKRDFRALWIQRINAAARENGIKYSQFIRALKVLGSDINRKVLSEIAVNNKEEFSHIVNKAKSIA